MELGCQPYCSHHHSAIVKICQDHEGDVGLYDFVKTNCFSGYMFPSCIAIELLSKENESMRVHVHVHVIPQACMNTSQLNAVESHWT